MPLVPVLGAIAVIAVHSPAVVGGVRRSSVGRGHTQPRAPGVGRARPQDDAPRREWHALLWSISARRC